MKNGYLILVLMLGLAACSGAGSKKSAVASGPLANLKIMDLKGNNIDWTATDGPVLLNMWATWCRPCKQEMPSLDAAWKTLEKEGWSFYAISNEPAEVISGFQQQMPYTFPMAQLDGDFQELNIYSIPTTYVISKKGQLVSVEVGARDWNSPASISKLRELADREVK